MEPYQQLEEEFGRFIGFPAENVVACSSGTAALHLALEALRLPAGSEVLVPDFTMVACARAVTLAGLTPAFVDCGDDLNMDPALAAGSQESPSVSAVMAVHVYGRKCDMNWQTTAETHRTIKVIEDLAEAHGIKPHPSTDAACWSFYKNKIVAGEEGGAVAFRDPVHAAGARMLRSLGFTDAHDFYHLPRGHNYRLANSLATLILQSLRQYEHNAAARRRIEGWYDAYCPDEWKMPSRDAVWVYDFRIPGLSSPHQDILVRTLNDAGIAARHAFKPMSMQAEYKSCRKVGPGITQQMSREVIYLPVQPGITTQEQAQRTFSMLRSLHHKITRSLHG